MSREYSNIGESSNIVVREHGNARRTRQTQDRILSAAAQSFTEEGYRATTIEGIAGRAEVAPSSVYYHFRSKGGVAQALADQALAVHADYVSRAWASAEAPLHRLIGVAGATLAFSRDQPQLFAAISLSYLGPLGMFPADTAAARAIAERREQQFDRIATALTEAVDGGLLRPLDTRAAAQFVIAAWAGVLTMGTGPGAPVDPGLALGAGIRALIEGTGTPRSLDAGGQLSPSLQHEMVRLSLAAEK